MRIEGVVWLNAIVDKLAVRHHVATHEVEEVLTSNPKFRFVEREDRQDEDISRLWSDSLLRHSNVLDAHVD